MNPDLDNMIRLNEQFKQRIRNGQVSATICNSDNAHSCYFCNKPIDGKTIVIYDEMNIRERELVIKSYSHILCYKKNISKEVC